MKKSYLKSESGGSHGASDRAGHVSTRSGVAGKLSEGGTQGTLIDDVPSSIGQARKPNHSENSMDENILTTGMLERGVKRRHAGSSRGEENVNYLDNELNVNKYNINYEYVGHLNSCLSIIKFRGVKIWPNQSRIMYNNVLVLSSKDMNSEDWDECNCVNSLNSYKIWTCNKLKPVRTWNSRSVSKKVKKWNFNGDGKYRDQSNSPIEGMGVGEVNVNIRTKLELSSNKGNLENKSNNEFLDNKTVNTRIRNVSEVAIINEFPLNCGLNINYNDPELVDTLTEVGSSAAHGSDRPIGLYKSGDHSVHGAEVKQTNLGWYKRTINQNIISQIVSSLPTWTDNMGYTALNHGVLLRTRYSIYTGAGDARIATVENTSPIIMAAHTVIQPITLNIRRGKEILYILKDSDAADLITNNTVDSRRLQSRMNAGPTFPAQVITLMAPFLLQRREKVNNVALYTYGWLLIHQVSMLNQHAIVPNVVVIPDDTMVLRNTNVPVVNYPELAAFFLGDLNAGRIFLDGSKFSVRELAVIRRIAGGFPMLNSPEDALISIIQYVVGEAIPMAVYHYGVLDVPAFAIGEWPATKIAGLLRKLATYLDDTHAWLQGFIRACTIVRGQRIERPNVSRWVNSLLEISGTALPTPGGTNPMWQWSGIKPVFVENPILVDEYTKLGTLQGQDIVFVSHLIGQLISTGISTTLMFLNITSVELNNRYFGNLTTEASLLIDSILQVERPNVTSVVPCPMMVRAGANWISRFTGMSLDWACLSSPCWNNYDEPTDAADGANVLWRGLCQGTPRLGGILSMGFWVDAYPDVWGVMAPPVKANTVMETITTGPRRYWSAHLGDKTYSERAGTRTPYIYVPYGAHVLGAIRQQLNINEEWVVPMRQFDTTAIRGVYEIGDIGQAVVPVQWAIVLGVALPGTLQTYNFETSRVLAPEMTLNQMGNAAYQYLSICADTELINAGLNKTYVYATKKVDVSLDGLDIWSDKDEGDAGASGSSQPNKAEPAPEN